jgi:hypothetical protein
LEIGRTPLAVIGHAYLGILYIATTGGEEVYLLNAYAEALATGLTRPFGCAKL